MKNPKTRIIIILTVVALAAVSFNWETVRCSFRARAQRRRALLLFGHEYRRNSRRPYASFELGRHRRLARNRFLCHLPVTNSASEILFRSENFLVPLGWRYLDVSRDQLGGSEALLQQVSVQTIVEAPPGSEPFGSVLIFDAATGLPVESVSFVFERITTQYPRIEAKSAARYHTQQVFREEEGIEKQNHYATAVIRRGLRVCRWH